MSRSIDSTPEPPRTKAARHPRYSSFSWKQLSVIAGLSYWRFYFRFFPGSIKSPQIVQFLQALHRTIGRKLLIIGDRLQAHRSRLVRHFVEQQRAQIALEYLPAYAPDLNPVECIWGYLKSHAIPNFCARDLMHWVVTRVRVCAPCSVEPPS